MERRPRKEGTKDGRKFKKGSSGKEVQGTSRKDGGEVGCHLDKAATHCYFDCSIAELHKEGRNDRKEGRKVEEGRKEGRKAGRKEGRSRKEGQGRKVKEGRKAVQGRKEGREAREGRAGRKEKR
jgi:hypothetical protein